MAQTSLYRKYRSQTFGELIGQDHVVRTLRNALATGKWSHSYLFTGPRGTGKTSTARLLAKCLCQPGGPTPDPDPEGEISLAIAAGTCVDVVEMDAASESGVDDIRQAIVEAVEYQPMMCPFKVFIIDEVHDLSAKAFDALLKTIEEPPPQVVFILATTEYNKVPATIRSRCQKFEFHRATIKDLVQVLTHVAEAEGVQVEPQALTAIAKMADGGYRDALTLLEQLVVVAEGPVTLQDVYSQLGLVSETAVDQLLISLAEGQVPRLYAELDAIASSGRDPRAILESLLHRLSDLTRVAFGVESGSGLDAPQEAALRALATQIGADKIFRYRSTVSELFKDIRDVSLPRLWLEAQLHQLAVPAPVMALAPAARQAPAAGAAKPAPAAKSVEKRPEPAAIPAPETPTEQQEPPRAAVIVESESTAPDIEFATPELREINQIWSRMLSALPATAHPLKLAGSFVAEVKEASITVQLNRQMDVEWYADKPQRVAYIAAQLKEVVDRPWAIKFRAGQPVVVSIQTETVELPLEGQALHDKLVEIFNS